MLYRIYTENKNEIEVENMIKTYSNSFVKSNTTTFWKGKRQNSLMFEFLIGNNNFGNRLMLQLGEEIKKMNELESVLVVKLHNEHQYV